MSLLTYFNQAYIQTEFKTFCESITMSVCHNTHNHGSFRVLMGLGVVALSKATVRLPGKHLLAGSTVARLRVSYDVRNMQESIEELDSLLKYV